MPVRCGDGVTDALEVQRRRPAPIAEQSSVYALRRSAALRYSRTPPVTVLAGVPKMVPVPDRSLYGVPLPGKYHRLHVDRVRHLVRTTTEQESTTGLNAGCSPKGREVCTQPILQRESNTLSPSRHEHVLSLPACPATTARRSTALTGYACTRSAARRQRGQRVVAEGTEAIIDL